MRSSCRDKKEPEFPLISDNLLKVLTDHGSPSDRVPVINARCFGIGTMVNVLKHWATTHRERER